MRITIIGGGSAQWAPTLLDDLALTRSVHGAEIVLEDIDAARGARAAAYAARVSDLAGAGFTIRETTDQREALRGADFVMVNISTGGFASMRVDLEVPWRYGIRQPGGDTIGPGGINRALRNVPVLVGIARDMERCCPDAWLLNLTNPMTALCRAVTKVTSIKTIGLCHEVVNFRGILSVLFDARFDQITLDVTGVNHVPIVSAIDLGDGRDGMALLRDVADGRFDLDDELPFELSHDDERGFSRPGAFGAAAHLPRKATKRFFVDEYAAGFDLFRRYGAFVAPGNRHTLEAFPAMLTEDADWGKRWGVHYTTIAEREAAEARYVSDLGARLASPEPPRFRSMEMASPIIDSIVRGKPRVFPLNIPNTGQCPDLPNDAVTESMCTVDGRGVHPSRPVRAPAFFAHWLSRIVASQELTVEAALTGDRDVVHAAMLIDPHAGMLGLASIEEMTGELLAGTRNWLPQFA